MKIRPSTLASVICSRGVSVEDAIDAIAGSDGAFIYIEDSHPILTRLSGVSEAAPDACVRDCLDRLSVAILKNNPKGGLGDMVAGLLSAVGITKERVSTIVGGPCGCRERQTLANQIGHKYLGLPTGTRG